MRILNRPLADELLKLAEVDQTMRMNVIAGEAEWDSAVDEISQTQLKAIVRGGGWPTISTVGADASHAAWLIVQHAPSLDFMKECLELMTSLPNGEVDPKDIAYLKDRVLMLSGKSQIYGTQFIGAGKDMHVYPIEDAERVNERRASIGLGTIAEDEAALHQLHKE